MRRLALLLTASVLVAGCSSTGGDIDAGDERASAAATPTEAVEAGKQGQEQEQAVTSYAVAKPGKFDGRTQKPDVLITGSQPLSDSLVDRVRSLDKVAAVLPLSVASASIDGRTLSVAAVDPAGFRRFTPPPSASADFVWDRVAGGEVAVDSSVSKKLVSDGDLMQLGTREDSPTVHVGAYAPLVHRSAGIGQTQPVIHAVVNAKRGEQLGIPDANALLVSTGTWTPSVLEKTLDEMLPDGVTAQLLALELETGSQTAVLTGPSVSDAVGDFTYTNGPDGTINPDAGWVEEYIRTEEVPILGTVTCNKGMLPQLRWALSEVVARGLADEIHPEEYAGCYYPRYIGRDPSNGLSLHSWGIAVDLNVPGNLRGTAGEIDRTVVAIFKKWGFAWGGDWNYTDPMHFEMNRVVSPAG